MKYGYYRHEDDDGWFYSLYTFLLILLAITMWKR